MFVGESAVVRDRGGADRACFREAAGLDDGAEQGSASSSGTQAAACCRGGRAQRPTAFGALAHRLSLCTSAPIVDEAGLSEYCRRLSGTAVSSDIECAAPGPAALIG